MEALSQASVHKEKLHTEKAIGKESSRAATEKSVLRTLDMPVLFDAGLLWRLHPAASWVLSFTVVEE